jgi:hypothetical protein
MFIEVKDALFNVMSDQAGYDIMSALRGPDFENPFYVLKQDEFGHPVYEDGKTIREGPVEVNFNNFKVDLTSHRLKSAFTGLIRSAAGRHNAWIAGVVSDIDTEFLVAVRKRAKEVYYARSVYEVPDGFSHFMAHAFEAFKALGLSVDTVNDMSNFRS